VLVRQVTIDWTVRFRRYLDEISELHPLRKGLSTANLGEALCCVVDGGILLARSSTTPAGWDSRS